MDHLTELGFMSGVAEGTGTTSTASALRVTTPTPSFQKSSSHWVGARGLHTDRTLQTAALSTQYPVNLANIRQKDGAANFD